MSLSVRHIKEETHHDQVQLISQFSHAKYVLSPCNQIINSTSITTVCTVFYDANYIETQIYNKVPNIEYPIYIYDANIFMVHELHV